MFHTRKLGNRNGVKTVFFDFEYRILRFFIKKIFLLYLFYAIAELNYIVVIVHEKYFNSLIRL